MVERPELRGENIRATELAGQAINKAAGLARSAFCIWGQRRGEERTTSRQRTRACRCRGRRGRPGGDGGERPWRHGGARPSRSVAERLVRRPRRRRDRRPGGAVRPDRRSARCENRDDPDRRAARPFGGEQPRRLSDLRPEDRPLRCRPQLRLQHPPGRIAARARRRAARRPCALPAA